MQPIISPITGRSLGGFHVLRSARDYYQFDPTLYVPIGNLAVPNFFAARVIASQLNDGRDLAAHPESGVYAGQVNAMSLIYEIQRIIFHNYLVGHPEILRAAAGRLENRLGTAAVEGVLAKYVDEFPPLPVYWDGMARADFLRGRAPDRSNREAVLEELLILWLANENPAFAPFAELFDADPLRSQTAYPALIESLRGYFGEPGNQDASGDNIFDLLLAPIRASPNSLEGQIAFLMQHYEGVLGDYVARMLGALDLIREESKPIFGGFGGPGDGDGHAEVLVPVYTAETYDEPENFTADRAWMPRLVLIAKNAYVWLDQLSKKYQRAITRLDQIPDEELDQLARWGITGLWLIGLWERSTASRMIKQIMGNTDAVASAYSLFDYQIAAGLGGEAACDNLRKRAWARGIRLASDMVPNHAGIDGRWVIEQPNWFINVDQSPFPGYTFNGANLSTDPRVGIYLEDHYYSRSDAAVVFKRVDHETGEARYLYHGNDGTLMPWNDTAQLNYIDPAVREAVIQTILSVARQFPVIRFDAAMTLAKRHIQRLWYPEPGLGGAIASRAEHAMTRSQFDALMPEEFWREVVDRAAVEAPDTLLLAEAFWMMESYFVRTLGMHRVYNSAFMNTLRDEENSKYRQVMKNTLEFDPEILRRYVNFLNNPDEKTAVAQFGKDDKYFGVCTMMVTMPGLPMFGHGQMEGFTEKYGMEYQRAYWDEQPDGYLIERHDRQIFPLVRRRNLFAGVEHFLLYDFFAPDGSVNEDVFAYSNRLGDERALVVYHNRFADVRGWIRSSVAFSIKAENSDERVLVQRTLGEGLGLVNDPAQFVIFRDANANLEYIRSSAELCEQGMYIELGAYRAHVFLDFRVVAASAEQPYHQLATSLAGRGVSSVREALHEMIYAPVREPFQALVNADLFRQLLAGRVSKLHQTPDTAPLAVAQSALQTLFEAIAAFTAPPALTPDAASSVQGKQVAETVVRDHTAQVADLSHAVRLRLEAALWLPVLDTSTIDSDSAAYTEAAHAIKTEIGDDEALWAGLLAWACVSAIGAAAEGSRDPNSGSLRGRTLIDEWLLDRVLSATLREFGADESLAGRLVAAIKLAMARPTLFRGGAAESAESLLTALLRENEASRFLSVNRFGGTLYYNKEAFDLLTRWLVVVGAVSALGEPTPDSTAARSAIIARHHAIVALRKASAHSDYEIEKLRVGLAQAATPQTESEEEPDASESPESAAAAEMKNEGG